MADPRFICFDIAHEIGAVAKSARHAVIAAPFITSSGMATLLDALPKEARIGVFTRWRASEVASGVSDPKMLLSVLERHGTVRLVDNLHAKVYLFDDRVAFVGSANLTEAALGISSDPNLEAVVALTPPPTGLFVFLHRLGALSTLATEAEMLRMLDAAGKIPKVEGGADERMSLIELESGDKFPRLRSPERLFEVYCDLRSALTVEEREQALDDLVVLRLRDGMAPTEFTNAVAAFLLNSLEVQGLDRYLDRPRRFGEITSYLAGRHACANRQTCQRHAQTLVRWLLFFLPSRYRTRQPNYSEILEKIT